MTQDLATKLSSRVARLWNAYGPTEATVWATLKEIDPNGPITIGKKISNYELLVLNKKLQPVPHGMQGDLYIAGPSLANGYLNRPDLTDDRFVFHEDLGCKIYDTGDVARFGPDGDIYYLVVRIIRLRFAGLESNWVKLNLVFNHIQR